MINRRQLLKVGAASMVVTGAGLGFFGATRRPVTALAPWQDDAHSYSDPRLRALSYAILAPNPHNRQPWQAELVGENRIKLTCNLERRLPETDPYDRQVTIGLGCFLELFMLAAQADGYDTEIDYFPEGDLGARLDGRVVALLTLERSEAVSPDPLFSFVKARRSNKEPYDTSREVSREVLDLLLSAGRTMVSTGGTLAVERVAALRDLSWRAHEIESLTPRTLQESVDLMRIGKDEINAQPDGIDLGGFTMELLAGFGLMGRAQMADPRSTVFRQGLDMYHRLLHTAMGYVWISTPDNTRRSQLEAGRAWLRVNLSATAQGLAIHPLSQALQEYPEMAALYREIHRELAIKAPSRIQMFARIGYGPQTPPSPRWAMENSLLKQA